MDKPGSICNLHNKQVRDRVGEDQSLRKLLNDLSLHHPIRIELYDGLPPPVAFEMDRRNVSGASKGDGRKPQLHGDTVVIALQHEAILVTITTGVLELRYGML